MRLSDLLRMRVVDRAGRVMGKVHDVRMGAPTPEGRSWSVTAVVVGQAAVGTRLGYAWGDVRGPWLLARVIRAVARHGRLVSWDRVVEVHETHLVVEGSLEESPRVSGSREADA